MKLQTRSMPTRRRSCPTRLVAATSVSALLLFLAIPDTPALAASGDWPQYHKADRPGGIGGGSPQVLSR